MSKNALLFYCLFSYFCVVEFKSNCPYCKWSSYLLLCKHQINFIRPIEISRFTLKEKYEHDEILKSFHWLNDFRKAINNFFEIFSFNIREISLNKSNNHFLLLLSTRFIHTHNKQSRIKVYEKEKKAKKKRERTQSITVPSILNRIKYIIQRKENVVLYLTPFIRSKFISNLNQVELYYLNPVMVLDLLAMELSLEFVLVIMFVSLVIMSDTMV